MKDAKEYIENNNSTYTAKAIQIHRDFILQSREKRIQKYRSGSYVVQDPQGNQMVMTQEEFESKFIEVNEQTG